MLDPPAEADSFPSASAKIDLAGFDFPEDASVALEAYFRSSSMRFSCGNIANLAVPERMELSDIDRGGAIRFRLLIIEPQSGRILGSAEGLRPARSGESPDRQPLLPLRETNLRGELWRIEVDARTGPVLCVNNTIPALAAQIRSVPLLQGLVLPHAFRMILWELSPTGEEEGDDLWGDDWRKFLRQIGVPSEPEDDDPDSIEEWVDLGVRSFCELKDFVSRIRLVDSVESQP